MASSTIARTKASTPASRRASETDAAPHDAARSAGEGPLAVERHVVRVQVPGMGTIPLPPLKELAYLAGVIVLATTGLMSWPVALTIGTGHLLAHNRHIQLLRAFGEALEEA